MLNCDLVSNIKEKILSPEVRRLVASAYHDCSAVAQDKIAMNHFLDGLGDPVVQDLVRFGLPDTLDKAVQLALQFHLSRSATRSNHKPVRLVRDTDALNSSSDSETTSLCEENVYGFDRPAHKPTVDDETSIAAKGIRETIGRQPKGA